MAMLVYRRVYFCLFSVGFTEKCHSFRCDVAALRHQLPRMHLHHLRPWKGVPKCPPCHGKNMEENQGKHGKSWKHPKKIRENMETPQKKHGKTWKHPKKSGKTWKHHGSKYGGWTEFCKSWDDGYQVIPLKTNMEPQNGPLEEEISFGNHHFQVPC